MKRFLAVRRILCMCIVAVLLLMPVTLPSAVFAVEEGAALGYSNVATDAAFRSAMSDPAVGTVVLQGDINASAVDWAAIQKGEKTIVGTTGKERLFLPALVSAPAKLTFDKLTLARGTAAGTQIYANAHAFRFGPELVMEEAFITALFGGGYKTVGLQADLTLESGAVSSIYMGGNEGAITGDATVSLWPKASVGNVYGAYKNSRIQGARRVILNGYGSDLGYAEQLPSVLGATSLRLSASHVKRRDWIGLGAEQLIVSADSVLWLDGSLTPGSRLHGEGGGLIVTAGCTVSLPDPAVNPGYLTGSWNLSMSAGMAGETSFILKNGGAYRSLFSVPDHLWLSGETDLTANLLYLDKIELDTLPKTAYFRGDALETAGGKLIASYHPAALAVKREIPLTNDMISGFDSSRVGPQTLTVTYEGKAISYRVWIADPDIARLSIHSIPEKTRYNIGESLNLTGGMVEVRYNNGALYRVPFRDESVVVEGFDSTETGNQTLLVRYNGQPAGSYTVTIRRQSSASSSSSSGSSYRGSDKPDDTRSVSLRGLPRDNNLEIGDMVTISVWPNLHSGSWDWDTNFFSGEVDEASNTLTLTARQKGRSRVVYEDSFARTTEILSITEERNSVDIPADMPMEDIPAAVVEPSELPPPPASSLPGGSLQDAYVEEEVSSKPEDSSREEHSREPVAPAPVVAEPEPEPAREAEETRPPVSRAPIAVAGIAAAALMLVIGGVCVWRVAHRLP